MKYITFAVPCYNSQDYMRRCIDSLLKGGDDVEILIINDGSADATAEIADEYEKIYPNIVKAVHKENGGHGSGVNMGLKLATGLYFKVVDSDDWLGEDAYRKLLETIKQFDARRREQTISNLAPADAQAVHSNAGQTQDIPDLFVCNYLYDHLDEGISREMNYRNIFPAEQICGWNEIGHFLPSQYLIMHALVYRTETLRESGVVLPEHTFYVDNIFAYQPLPFVEHIYYMDIPLYHYYLGREDQSVNEKVLMKRIDQQIKVTEIVASCVDLEQVAARYPKLAVYMRRNISIMMAISSIHLLLIGTEDALHKRDALWNKIKTDNPKLYFQLRCQTISGLTYLPGRFGGNLTVNGYRLARKIYHFQ